MTMIISDKGEQMGIKVSELFRTFQGEVSIGIPSIFLRVFGCNFQCAGFGMPQGEKSQERFLIHPDNFKSLKELPILHTGCDTFYSWDSRFKHFSPMMQIKDIVDEMSRLLPNGKFNQEHLVITGGEPLLGWQKQYPELLKEIQNREMNLRHLTFETNGTQTITSELRWGLNFMYNLTGNFETIFSCSPKLPCSGEPWDKAINPEIVMSYTTIPGSQVYLKFVVATEEDVADAKKAIKEYEEAGFTGKIYLMPIGGTEEGYYMNNKKVAELALKNGYCYSPRLQVDLWGNAMGT